MFVILWHAFTGHGFKVPGFKVPVKEAVNGLKGPIRSQPPKQEKQQFPNPNLTSPPKVFYEFVHGKLPKISKIDYIPNS